MKTLKLKQYNIYKIYIQHSIKLIKFNKLLYYEFNLNF
jgi:hypothetical protein